MQFSIQCVTKTSNAGCDILVEKGMKKCHRQACFDDFGLQSRTHYLIHLSHAV